MINFNVGMQGQWFNRFAIVLGLAIIITSPDVVRSSTPMKADIAIVIDISPFDENDFVVEKRHMDYGNEAVRAMYNALRVLNSSDFEFGLYFTGRDGSSRKVSIGGQPNRWLFESEISKGFPFSFDNKPYDHSDMETIVNNIRGNLIETDPGNRGDAPDLVIWVVNGETRCKNSDDEDRVKETMQKVKAIYLSAKETIEVLVVLHWTRKTQYQFASWHDQRPLVICKTPEFDPDPKILDIVGDETFNSLSRETLMGHIFKKRVPQCVQNLLTSCNGTKITLGQCYFDANHDCKQIKYFEDPRLNRYCRVDQSQPRQTAEVQCNRGINHCTTLCSEANDNGDEVPCDASCGQKGIRKYRTSKAKTDTLYRHCPWFQVECYGPPCSTTSTTSTTTTTTTPTTTTSTTTTSSSTTTSTTTTTSSTTTTPTTTTSSTSTTITKSRTRTKPDRSTKAATAHKVTVTEPPVKPTSVTVQEAGEETTEKPETALESWHIAAIVIGVLAVLGFFIFLIVCITASVKKRKARQKRYGTGHGGRSPRGGHYDSRHQSRASMDRTGTGYARSGSRESTDRTGHTSSPTRTGSPSRGTDRTGSRSPSRGTDRTGNRSPSRGTDRTGSRSPSRGTDRTGSRSPSRGTDRARSSQPTTNDKRPSRSPRGSCPAPGRGRR